MSTWMKRKKSLTGNSPGKRIKTEDPALEQMLNKPGSAYGEGSSGNGHFNAQMAYANSIAGLALANAQPFYAPAHAIDNVQFLASTPSAQINAPGAGLAPSPFGPSGPSAYPVSDWPEDE